MESPLSIEQMEITFSESIECVESGFKRVGSLRQHPRSTKTASEMSQTDHETVKTGNRA